MKIKTRICDVCGETIYQHTKHIYTIRKKMPECGEIISKRIDLCEDCWRDFEKWVNHKKAVNEEIAFMNKISKERGD